MTDHKPPSKVRFIKPPNTLKQKVGSGGIDEKLLDQAQEVIKTTSFDFTPTAEKFLKEAEKQTKQAQKHAKEAKAKGANFEKLREKMIAPMMQLKANGGMFRYQLVSDVADLAMQFLEAIDELNDDGFKVLIAHMNTINVIVSNRLEGDGGKQGYALVKELHQACKRYFSKHKKSKK